jgi:hypothetical protein
MKTPIDKARGEGNCVGAIQGGEEAGAKSARLRTETSYKAGSVRRVSTTSRSRSQTIDQVKGGLVQRKFMSLSGETCQTACESSFAPASKHLRLKGWNRLKQFNLGEAGVSRGHSTELPIPMGTGRTEQ